MKISVLSKENVNSVTKLLNSYLSFGLATEENVEKYAGYELALVCMENDAVLGFTLAYKMKNINEELLGHQDLIHMFKDKKNLYILKQIVVDESYRKRGIGDLLLKTLLERLKEKAIITIGWEKPEGCDSKGILIKNGFKEIARKEKFWYEDSIKEKYGCPYCSEEYCKCAGILFYKSN
jgi:GNAT superfamily N-acetyltransferase